MKNTVTTSIALGGFMAAAYSFKSLNDYRSSAVQSLTNKNDFQSRNIGMFEGFNFVGWYRDYRFLVADCGDQEALPVASEFLRRIGYFGASLALIFSMILVQNT